MTLLSPKYFIESCDSLSPALRGIKFWFSIVLSSMILTLLNFKIRKNEKVEVSIVVIFQIVIFWVMKP
jgi:hypothetical protein